MIISTRRHRARAWILIAMPVSFIAVFYIQLNRQLQHNGLLKDLGHFSEAFGSTLGSISAYSSLYIVSTTSGIGGSRAPKAPVPGGTPPSDAMLAYWRELWKALVDARPKTVDTVVVTDSVTDYDIQPDPEVDRHRQRVDKLQLSDGLRKALRSAHTDFVKAAGRLSERLPYDADEARRQTGDNDEMKKKAKDKKEQQLKLSTMMRSEMRAVRAQSGARRQHPHATHKRLGTEGTEDMEAQEVAEAAEAAEAAKAQEDDAAAAASSTSKNVTPAAAPSRGIVMTAGGSYVGIAVTSLLMLRRSGSQLPVQVFLDSDDDYDEVLCSDVFPRLGASCHVMRRFWDATPRMAPLSKYQFKVFAILLSSFRQVLFLDADCWPIRSPDYLFDTEPFVDRGLITWPDFWLSTAAPALYGEGQDGKDGKDGTAGILGIPELPLTARRSSESGILLYDKARQAKSLLLAAYYNFYGPDYYYPLLSQGAIGQGDKETFLHGAMVAGAPFYDVRTNIGILGRWMNGTYVGAAMRQADPAEDYALSQEAAHVPGPGGSSGGDIYIKARPLFVHHNLVKIDIRQLGRSMERVYATDAREGTSRLWHVDAEFLDGAGYDVEQALWTEVMRALCGRQSPSTQTQDCADLRRYYLQVFGQ